MKRHEPRMSTAALQVGLDADSAADAVQEAFMTLLENLDALRNPDRLGAWLRTIVERHGLRGLELQRHLPTAARLPEEDLSTRELEPEDPRAIVREALSTLDSRCRDLIGMLYASNPTSYEDVSRALGLAIGSIGPTRGRCLEKLLEAIERLEDG